MAFGALGALDTGFGKLGLQPAAGTSTPAPPPSGTSMQFNAAANSQYVPLFVGFP